MSQSSGPAARAQPFYCPYCGEEDFTPSGEERGTFVCNSCARHYKIQFIGLASVTRDARGDRL
jgi:hypothetical protein